MASSRSSNAKGVGEALLWDLLTFERLMTGPVIHLIYWAGLGVLALMAFSALGAAIGVALRETSILGKLLAIPVLIAGLLFCAAGVLLWRSFCEFYVAIFRISDDLRAMREGVEAEQRTAPRL
jgi:ABC-type transport system involved in cytochrome c biogenesis permease component